MSGLHWQEQFFSMNGKMERQRSLRGGRPERWLDCGTCSAHHMHTYPCIYSVFVWHGGLIVCTIAGASIPRAGKSLVKRSTVLKVIFDRFLGHSTQKKRFFATYVHIALGNCKNFRNLNFVNLHGFSKFAKITSRENLYAYSNYWYSASILTVPVLLVTLCLFAD